MQLVSGKSANQVAKPLETATAHEDQVGTYDECVKKIEEAEDGSSVCVSGLEEKKLEVVRKWSLFYRRQRASEIKRRYR